MGKVALYTAREGGNGREIRKQKEEQGGSGWERLILAERLTQRDSGGRWEKGEKGVKTNGGEV